ncbi:MAG TPA: hypothetical protein VN373_03170, partial [Methanosarcina barkeri]|nr:hypothetical protein [Methanosarcina barkeri]
HHNCDDAITIGNYIHNKSWRQNGRVAMPPAATRRYVSSILTSDLKKGELYRERVKYLESFLIERAEKYCLEVRGDEG